MEENVKKNQEAPKKGLWRIIDSIEGDKVIWIITLLLIVISILAVFSSTSMIKSDESRIEIMKDHCRFAAIGLGIIFVMYKWIRWIGVYRVLSQLGFFVSLVLLAILDSGADLGFIKSETINGATRTLGCYGIQIHVFEIVKVAMVMYLAWALHSYKQDCQTMEEGKKSNYFLLANWLGSKKYFEFMKHPFAKRMFYIYIPSLITIVLVAFGSNSSAIFIGIVLLGTMMIGGLSFKELAMLLFALFIVGAIFLAVYKSSDGETEKGRVDTAISRLTTDYRPERLAEVEEGSKEFYKILDTIRQPNGAKVAIKEGKIFGKFSGNSTQKYVVSHIYSDYMFSFLVEEYGFLGGIVIILLYISLIARSSIIARLCGNEFAKIAVGGLAFLITGQAFMHMMVNVGLGPTTGQTLPLISHGASAFLSFCIAFGVILSISRMARKKIQSIESTVKATDDIGEKINIIAQTDDETYNRKRS